jgi:PST family polysaccharide transporter
VKLAFSKEVISNSGFLMLMQVFNYLIPFVVLPFLSRTLDLEEYGVVMVALSTVLLTGVITDYGFSFSATNEISKDRSNTEMINRLVAQIFTAKLLLVVIACGVLIFISLLPHYSGYRWVFWAGLGAIVAQAYQPLWLFLGLGKMQFYALYSVIAKLTYLVLVVTTARHGNPEAVLLSWSAAQILGAVVGLYLIRAHGYRAAFAPFQDAWAQLRSSAEFFWSRVAVATYTSASSVVVGTAGLQQAAFYSSAEQGYRAGQAFTNSIANALFPFMSKERNWRVFFGALAVSVPLLLVGVAGVGYFAGPIIEIVFGAGFDSAVPVLRIMMFTLVLSFFAVLLGYPAFTPFEALHHVNRSVMFGAAVFCLGATSLWVAGSVDAVSVALLITLTEAVVLTYRAYFLLRLVRQSAVESLGEPADV